MATENGPIFFKIECESSRRRCILICVSIAELDQFLSGREGGY